MATYNVTGAVAGIPLGKKMQTVEVVLDFTSTNLAAGDIVNVFEIPDNTLVLMAGIEVFQAASTGSPTIDMGDAGAADTWVTDVSGSAVAQEFGQTAKLYTAADNIDIIGVTATFDGKIRCVAVMCDLGDPGVGAPFA
jgi:hypothetical protein